MYSVLSIQKCLFCFCFTVDSRQLSFLRRRSLGLFRDKPKERLRRRLPTTRTLANSNLPLTQTNFRFRLQVILYIILPSIHVIRTPDNSKLFLFLFGDYNINILSFDTHNPTGEFINLMSSNGFYPLISKPTRITFHTATLIDNIFTNDLDHDKFSGIFWSDISDHLPIFQITNFSLKTKTKPSVYHKRLITTHRIEKFRSHLISTDWNFIQSPSPNELYNSFMGFLCPIYEKCFPVTTNRKN